MNIIVRRKLKDYEAWKKVVTQPDGQRKQHGSRGATVYRSAADPNEVFLVFEWDDAKDFNEYINRPEVKESLDRSGTSEFIEISESFWLAE